MGEEPKLAKAKQLPFIMKRGGEKNYEVVFQCTKNARRSFKEDIVYVSNADDFLCGKYPDLIISNRLNVSKSTSRTIAAYMLGDAKVELTSDAVTRVIGQGNYDTVFAALCSVISQEQRVKGILSLLTEDNRKSVESQTFESYRGFFIRENKRKTRNRKPKVTSYVVTDHMQKENVKKVVIDPSEVSLSVPQVKVELVEEPEEPEPQTNLPDIQGLLDEDSNISDTSIGNISIGNFSIPDILENPSSILNNIDKHTEENAPDLNIITMLDGSCVTIKGNPDKFHLATPEILNSLSSMDRKRVLCHQAYIDWKFCLERDEDGYLPLHCAVLNKDVELLKRQCAMLKTRHESVDIPATGTMTALQMSIQYDATNCTPVLLQHGADPLILDEETRTPLHLAADVSPEHTLALIEHCKAHAREILKDNEDLWQPKLEKKTDKDLSSYLLTKMCSTFDNQGYTPVMIASKMGKHENVRLLLEAAPNSVNLVMPTCGNTALYIAVGAACLDCSERGDKTKVSTDFLETIMNLMKYGADPDITNCSGSTVNMLLNENINAEISTIIASNLACVQHINGQSKRYDEYILVKDRHGNVNLEEIRPKKHITKITNVAHVKNVREINANNTETKKNEQNNTETKKNEQTEVTKPKIIHIKINNAALKKKIALDKTKESIVGKTVDNPVTLQNPPPLIPYSKKIPIILKKINTVKILPKSAPRILYKRVSEDSEAGSSKKPKS